MDVELPSDFKEFLRLLRSHGVRYLLVGGHAVIYYDAEARRGSAASLRASASLCEMLLTELD